VTVHIRLCHWFPASRRHPLSLQRGESCTVTMPAAPAVNRTHRRILPSPAAAIPLPAIAMTRSLIGHEVRTTIERCAA